uniref:NADH-ubiquinone oxidoreductase chain 2 n=1 Tax=Bradysia impatiens TaxID=335710 RepID=A0A8F2YVY3_9DIPT|nr:NADH deshydrogenase subunit 2 [Bradysia impatiens]
MFLKNLSKMLFMFMIWLGTMIVISANSWLGLWMGLEINLLSLIPILTSNNNLSNSEAALNYFLVQAFASITLLFSMIMFIILNNLMFMTLFLNFYMPNKIILLSLMMKLGAPPFHFWFPNVMENINWNNNFLLMTWQKIGPMMIMNYFIKFDLLMISFILLAAFIGSIGGLNQISLRKIMAFSSINHLGWMFSAILYNENIWIIYFMIYSFMVMSFIYMLKIMKIFYLNQLYMNFFNNKLLKFLLLSNMLSLGGLPPLLGFFPKWIIIQSLSYMNLNLMILFLICMSMITLYYYLKIMFSAIMFNYMELNFFYFMFTSKMIMFTILITNFMSIFSFFLMINLIFFI